MKERSQLIRKKEPQGNAEMEDKKTFKKPTVSSKIKEYIEDEKKTRVGSYKSYKIWKRRKKYLEMKSHSQNKKFSRWFGR